MNKPHSRRATFLLVILICLTLILLYSLLSIYEDAQYIEEPAITFSYDTLAVDKKINLWAFRYGIDAKMAREIAWCESGHQNICNRQGCAYGQGIFQFIPSTWKLIMAETDKQGDPLNEDLNIQAGCYLLSTQGAKPWRQSAHCHGYY